MVATTLGWATVDVAPAVAWVAMGCNQPTLRTDGTQDKHAYRTCPAHKKRRNQAAAAEGKAAAGQ